MLELCQGSSALPEMSLLFRVRQQVLPVVTLEEGRDVSQREVGSPRQRKVVGLKAESGKALLRGRRRKMGGAVSALSAFSSLLSWAVVEVTGHAHVLLAAFEKVSAILPLDLGAVGREVVF